MKSLLTFALIMIGALALNAQSEDFKTSYITPTRIVWKNGSIKNEQLLLQPGTGQAELSGKPLVVLQNTKDGQTSIVLDFGKELQGGLQIITGIWGGNKPIKARIRFGESVSETMSRYSARAARRCSSRMASAVTRTCGASSRLRLKRITASCSSIMWAAASRM